MGSDRARISFDPTRNYRAVEAQQGRVTLEADINEQAAIASEALRTETIDVIGPAGTPQQSGYQVALDAKKHLLIEPGTMYLGGWRMQLDHPVPLANQPDWLNQPVHVASEEAAGQNSLVALLLSEQSVSATEDHALREVALGGPDTAARTRLMQHFVQIPTTAHLCDDAEEVLAKTLRKMGLILNPRTRALDFHATLKVSFHPPSAPTNPCCPPAQGGYLGADNQMVRVAIVNYSSPSGTLLWSWNNASFLYRVTAVGSHLLRLETAPIDAAHTPQPGQVIELLHTQAVLGNPQDGNLIAAQQGQLISLGSGAVYDSATRQLTLPASTALPTDAHGLFVRLWQAEVPFTHGQAVQLDEVSGMAVTVNLSALPKAPFQARPYWCFAVRPNTPQMVYPQRYLEADQPPDGPRQWLCNLAIVKGSLRGGYALLADCRKHFVPLTEVTQGDCCHLVLDPAEDWLGILNAALASNSKSLNLCFQPGLFKVSSKILFKGKHCKITGAGRSTVLVGSTLEAVLEFDDCPSLTLSDLCVEAGDAGFSTGTVGLQGAVTVRNCAQVDIEHVWLACADADLRSASCLAVYYPAPAADAVPPPSNLRVRNSQFRVGHCQVGLLLVNADRAQIEGNLVSTPQVQRHVTLSDLPSRPIVAARLKRNILHAMTITNTAPAKTARATARLLKRQSSASTTVPANAAMTTKGPTSPSPSIESVVTPASVDTVAGKLPIIHLGEVGRAHVNATFGKLQLKFISSDKLTNAWTDALRLAGLNENSTVRELYNAVDKMATAVFKKPDAVAPAFRNYASSLLPQLYSTSAQGIVVAGIQANDIRILHNTIDGTTQGIHVGLSNLKATPPQTQMPARAVQICGNTIHIRLTPEMTGDRHGIFLGCATSALINDNHLELTRSESAGQDIYAIKVVGFFGPRLLIERNCMIKFSCGIFTLPFTRTERKTFLWKAADNASTSANFISTPPFIERDNFPD